MKKTTYILIGMVIFGFALITAYYGMLCYYSKFEDERIMKFEGELAHMSIPPCKIVTLDASSSRFKQSCLSISNSSSRSGKFSFPADLKPYLSTVSMGDTCKIQFKLPNEVRQQYVRNQDEWMFVSIQSLALALPQTVNHLEINWHDLPVKVSEVQRDSLFMVANGEVDFRRCKFNGLQINQGDLYFKHDTINRLYLDLDGVHQWYVERDSCMIEVETLMGSRAWNNCYWQSGESKELRWIPKSPDAVLEVSLKEPVVIKKLSQQED